MLSIKDLKERKRLIESTLNGEKWRVTTGKGKLREVTDREMVDLAQQLKGWTKSVYKFGCAFIHLSNFHAVDTRDPLGRLSSQERSDVLSHMRSYHGGPASDRPDLSELSIYLPRVLEKISTNLECYLVQLERNEQSEP